VSNLFFQNSLLSLSIALCCTSWLFYFLWYWYYIYDLDIHPYFRVAVIVTVHPFIPVRALKPQTYFYSWEGSERLGRAIKTLVKSIYVSEWSCLPILNTLIVSYFISHFINNATWSVSQPTNYSTKLRWSGVIVFATDMIQELLTICWPFHDF